LQIEAQRIGCRRYLFTKNADFSRHTELGKKKKNKVLKKENYLSKKASKN
jgi:hypothetical protein